jgi:deoxyxylulose-5-phosphate synthase
MESYDQRIRREIGSEITHARELLSLAVAFPTLLFRTFKNNDAVWETFCNVLQGIESFDHLRKVIGNVKALKGPQLLHVITRKGYGYARAEDEARSAGRGLWRAANPVEPSEFRREERQERKARE